MFCQYCGSKLPDGVKFCTACGEKVNVPAQSAPAAEVKAEPVYAKPEPAPVAKAEPVYVKPEPAPAYRVQPAYGPVRKGMPFNIVAALFALVAVVGMFFKMIQIYGMGNSLFEALFDSFSLGSAMGGFAGVLVIIIFVALVLFNVLTFITSFLRRRISMVFSILGVLLLVALVVLMGSALAGEFTFELIGYMAVGYYLMLGGLLLNFIAQLFYHPNR